MFLEVDIQFAFAMEFTTSVLDTCSGKYTVQRRNQDECQHSRYRQTTDYGQYAECNEFAGRYHADRYCGEERYCAHRLHHALSRAGYGGHQLCGDIR